MPELDRLGTLPVKSKKYEAAEQFKCSKFQALQVLFDSKAPSSARML